MSTSFGTTSSSSIIPSIGIDLGTTNSCVASVLRSVPTVLAVGARTTPSIVAYTQNGILVGEQARRQALLNSTNTIFSAKRLIGRQINEVKELSKHLPYSIAPDPNGSGEAWIKIPAIQQNNIKSPIEIGSEVLKEMTKIARESLKTTVSLPENPNAVITCPAYFNDTQRKATEKAGQMAGLNVLRIINEPTAAALLYNFVSKTKMKDGEIFAVFDLGGGTYDVSILQHTIGPDGNDVFNVLSTSGDTELGGDDWDNVLLSMLKEDLLTKNNLPSEFLDSSSTQRLKEAAEQAKKDLSKQKEVVISLPFIAKNVDGSPINLIKKITRKEFEEASASLFKRLEKPCKAAMRDAGVLNYLADDSNNQEISKVLLVGGMTKMPAIKEAVKKVFKINGSSAMNPDEAVALGAAVQGAVLSKTLANVLLLDVTPLSLGIETMGGAFSSLIKRNTTIPVKKSSLFTTACDNQSSVKIKILQGEREIASQNHLLGEFELTGIPAAPRGVPKIEVTFEIDENGIVNVSARDQASGIKKHIKIAKKANISLTEEDEKNLKTAEKFAAIDKKLREIIEVKNDADGLVYSLNDALKNIKHKLPKKTQDKCDRILGEANWALGRCDNAIKQENNEETLKTTEEIKTRETELQDTLIAIKRARDKVYKMTTEVGDTLYAKK